MVESSNTRISQIETGVCNVHFWAFSFGIVIIILNTVNLPAPLYILGYTLMFLVSMFCCFFVFTYYGIEPKQELLTKTSRLCCGCLMFFSLANFIFVVVAKSNQEEYLALLKNDSKLACNLDPNNFLFEPFALSVAVSQSVHLYSEVDPFGYKQFDVDGWSPVIASTTILMSLLVRAVVYLVGFKCYGGAGDHLAVLLQTDHKFEVYADLTVYIYLLAAIILELGCRIWRLVRFLKKKQGNQQENQQEDAEAQVMHHFL